MKRRILFDSNVWRYVVDADALPLLMTAARQSRHVVVIPPAVLYEAAKTGNAAVRDKLLSAMTLPLWKRLMPEAYSEAAEIRAEVIRVRPEWLKTHPDLTLFKRLRHDWIRGKNGSWDRVRMDPQAKAILDEDVLGSARKQAYELREESTRMSAKWRTLPLTKMTGAPTLPVAGWTGVPAEPWRFAALEAFSHALRTRVDHPYWQWLGGDLDLELMLFQADVLGRFWLHDVETLNMPRHWLRWGFEFLQLQYKVSDGTPVDAQIGTYLIDADLFMSADKTMVRIAEKCRDDAPFSLAESLRVPAGPSCIDVVIEQLLYRD